MAAEAPPAGAAAAAPAKKPPSDDYDEDDRKVKEVNHVINKESMLKHGKHVSLSIASPLHAMTWFPGESELQL